ncbi:MAG: disulfide bond formation protein B [Pseudomonadota bacterium]
MTDYGRILLAGFGSALILAAAFAFQYLGGLAPCPMCLWQRWPHLAAALIAIVAITIGWRFRRFLAGLGGVAALITAAIGAFHAGVEQKWWEGPSTCSAPDQSKLSAAELLSALQNTPVVRCDEIVWQMGLTMAGWNAVISLCLAGLWFWPV